VPFCDSPVRDSKLDAYSHRSRTVLSGRSKRAAGGQNWANEYTANAACSATESAYIGRNARVAETSRNPTDSKLLHEPLSALQRARSEVGAGDTYRYRGLSGRRYQTNYRSAAWNCNGFDRRFRRHPELE
jgi:hypothetical protein